MARRLYQYFYNDPLAEASWRIADTTAASLDALGAIELASSSSSGSNVSDGEVEEQDSNSKQVSSSEEDSSSDSVCECAEPTKRQKVMDIQRAARRH